MLYQILNFKGKILKYRKRSLLSATGPGYTEQIARDLNEGLIYIPLARKFLTDPTGQIFFNFDLVPIS